MKKIKLTFAALALVAGVGFAVASNAGNNSAASGTTLYWFDASGVYQQSNTVGDEMSATGCSLIDNPVCERGYTSSQLVNPSNPSQGLKPNQTPLETIFQQ